MKIETGWPAPKPKPITREEFDELKADVRHLQNAILRLTDIISLGLRRGPSE